MTAAFKLGWHALVRGHVLTLLLAATALVHLLLPRLVRGDGTSAGWREMFVRAVPGATFAITALAVLVCACGVFSQERARRRLALTVVRPASLFGVAVGRWLAFCAVSALVCVLTAACTAFRVTDAPRCMHHHASTMPPPVEVARVIMADYLQHPETIEDPVLRAVVTNSPPAAVLRLLANKELDRYDVVAPNVTVEWPFDPALADVPEAFVRVRFATQLDLSSTFAGTFTLAGWNASISNRTQSVLDVPLERGVVGKVTGPCVLRFTNTGDKTVMLRPRRDLEVLVPADSFVANLARAAVQMFAMFALLAAFGIFLSSALSRPVAVFTAVVALIVFLMAPSVIDSFPDGITVALVDRIGLVLARGSALLTSVAGETQPISDLATDTCIEWGALARGLLVNAGVLPAVFLCLSALLVRNKPLADQT